MEQIAFCLKTIVDHFFLIRGSNSHGEPGNIRTISKCYFQNEMLKVKRHYFFHEYLNFITFT